MRHETLPDDFVEFDRLLAAGREVDGGDWTMRRKVWSCSQIAHALTQLGAPTASCTVRRWCADGLLRAEKTSRRGHYRVAAAALRVYLNGHAMPLTDPLAA